MNRLLELIEINRAIAGSVDYDEALRLIVEKTAGFTRAGAAVLLLADAAGTARVAAAWGTACARLEAFTAPLDERIGGSLRAFLGFPRNAGFLAVPVVRSGRVSGLLVVCRQTPFPAEVQGLPGTVSEAFLLSALADQAAIALDHADRLREAEAAASEARAAETRFRALVEGAPDAMVIVDRDARIVLMNVQAQRWFGYAPEELLGAPIERLIPERYHVSHRQRHGRYFASPQLRPMGAGIELYGCRRDGTEFPVEVSLSPLETEEGLLVTAVIRDITERKRAQSALDHALERERHKAEQLTLAIREAHHRIKNNLQAISDLLSLEFGSAKDPAASLVLRESMERVQAIALVHDLLSQRESVEVVDIRRVAERLVPMVLNGGQSRGTPVDLVLEIPSLQLPSKPATTLTLILNELVSNAVKHALRPGTPRLEVKLSEGEGGWVLTVQDDGPGLRPDFDVAVHANVGLLVVQTLAESNLGGSLRLSAPPGLRADVWFPTQSKEFEPAS